MNTSASNDYYGEGRVTQHAQTRIHIDKITFNSEDNVLDVGCGSGDETKLIATKVRSVTGIDPSDKMLALARKFNSAPNTSYYKGKAQTVGDNPDWQESFDKIVCLHSLHWVPDKKKAIRSILACLKHGGEALFIVGNRSPLVEDLALFLRNHVKWGKYVKDYEWPIYELDHSPSECRELFDECGWKNAQCETVEYDSTHRNEAHIKLYFKIILGYTSMIPEEEQARYLDDLWRWALSKYSDNVNDNKLKLPVYQIVVHACK